MLTHGGSGRWEIYRMLSALWEVIRKNLENGKSR
jgi:hypothetical protein